MNTDDRRSRRQAGDSAASAALLDRHRARLKRMIAVRMDPRLGRRIDPSDVVQDTLAVALKKLPRYLSESPLPFYPWLRQIAWNRLVDLHRRHVRAGNRTVRRENHTLGTLDNRSARLLADRLGRLSSPPSARMIHEEVTRREGCDCRRVELNKHTLFEKLPHNLRPGKPIQVANLRPSSKMPKAAVLGSAEIFLPFSFTSSLEALS